MTGVHVFSNSITQLIHYYMSENKWLRQEWHEIVEDERGDVENTANAFRLDIEYANNRDETGVYGINDSRYNTQRIKEELVNEAMSQVNWEELAAVWIEAHGPFEDEDYEEGKESK